MREIVTFEDDCVRISVAETEEGRTRINLFCKEKIMGIAVALPVPQAKELADAIMRIADRPWRKKMGIGG